MYWEFAGKSDGGIIGENWANGTTAESSGVVRDVDTDERATESARLEELDQELLLPHDDGGVGSGGRDTDFRLVLTLRPRSDEEVLDRR